MNAVPDDNRDATQKSPGRCLAQPLAGAVLVGSLLALVMIPATYHALLDVAGGQAASEDRRALAVARRMTVNGPNETTLFETLRTVRSCSSGLTAGFVRTAGGAVESGSEMPVRLLAIGPNGIPVVLPDELSGPIDTAAAQAVSSQGKDATGSACIDGGEEAPLLCVVALPSGALAGVVAGRTKMLAPYGLPAAGSVVGALLFLLAAWWKPSWRLQFPAAVTAVLVSSVVATLVVVGARTIISNAASAEASLAGILGPLGGPVTPDPQGPGLAFVLATVLASTALATGGAWALGRIFSLLRGPR